MKFTEIILEMKKIHPAWAAKYDLRAKDSGVDMEILAGEAKLHLAHMKRIMQSQNGVAPQHINAIAKRFGVAPAAVQCKN